MGWLDKITGRTPAQEIALVSAAADVKGAPGTRVYHEYFVDDEPTNGRYGWLCRVYAQDGTPHQTTGSEETDRSAREAAIAWADATKSKLRGAA